MGRRAPSPPKARRHKGNRTAQLSDRHRFFGEVPRVSLPRRSALTAPHRRMPWRHWKQALLDDAASVRRRRTPRVSSAARTRPFLLGRAAGTAATPTAHRAPLQYRPSGLFALRLLRRAGQRCGHADSLVPRLAACPPAYATSSQPGERLARAGTTACRRPLPFLHSWGESSCRQ